MRLFCDFDGTITSVDTAELVLSRFADPRWQQLEADWIGGRIDAATCMREQVGMIAATDLDLDSALDCVELSEGFLEFVDWCERSGHRLTIVSDGVDRFIGRVLQRHGLGRLRFVANRLAGDESDRRLDQPWRVRGCGAGSGVCKCAVTASGTGSGRLVYIGDGRSDTCVAARADILFAKGTLAEHAARYNLPFHTYTNFHQVLDVLGPAHSRRCAAGRAGTAIT